MMQKINTVFDKDHQLNKLVAEIHLHQNIQQFWQTATPKTISEHSFASNLSNGILTVYAFNGAIASKIKLTSASLLTQLQNLQKTNAAFQHYKVTGISVKVQVKSQQKPPTTEQRTISSGAAATLNQLANELGDSALADKLKKIARNSQ